MKILLLLSGGLDSVTALYLLRSQGHHVEGFFFDYDQAHYTRESRAAETICEELGVKLHHGKLAVRFQDHSRFSSTPLTTKCGDSDIVVNRNANLIIAAATYALGSFDNLAIATNADDAEDFPDCSIAFMSAMAETLQCCHSSRIQLVTPFIEMTKADVAKLAVRLGVPIDDTWSCYKGGSEPCGECGACKLRESALEQIVN